MKITIWLRADETGRNITLRTDAKPDALEITADNYAAADILATLEEVGDAADGETIRRGGAE